MKKKVNEEREMRKNDPVVAALDNMLDRLFEVSFDGMKKGEIVASVIEILMTTVNKAGYDIPVQVSRGGAMEVYYNNERLKLEMTLQNFLMEAAIRIGVPEFEARYYLFADSLYKQFLHAKRYM
jgi:hypothetical protein